MFLIILFSAAYLFVIATMWGGMSDRD